MPLDIKTPEPPKQLTPKEAFELEVVKVADKYARSNRWCGEVDLALKELGLNRKMLGSDESLLRVTAQVTIPVEVVLDIDPADFAGKTPDEQNKLLQSKLRKRGLENQVIGVTQVYGSDTRRRRSTVLQANRLVVSDINEYEVPSAQVEGFTIPRGYFGYYTSGAGRVMHLERSSIAGNQTYIRGLCGSTEMVGAHGVRESERATGTVCARCRTALERQQAAAQS